MLNETFSVIFLSTVNTEDQDAVICFKGEGFSVLFFVSRLVVQCANENSPGT